MKLSELYFIYGTAVQYFKFSWKLNTFCWVKLRRWCWITVTLWTNSLWERWHYISAALLCSSHIVVWVTFCTRTCEQPVTRGGVKRVWKLSWASFLPSIAALSSQSPSISVPSSLCNNRRLSRRPIKNSLTSISNVHLPSWGYQDWLFTAAAAQRKCVKYIKSTVDSRFSVAVQEKCLNFNNNFNYKVSY